MLTKSSKVLLVTALVAIMFSFGCNGDQSPKNVSKEEVAKSSVTATTTIIAKQPRPPEVASTGEYLWLLSEQPESQVFVVRDPVEGGHEGYLVRILDTEKKVMYEGRIAKRANYEPRTKMIDGYIVEIRQGAGTGIWYSYYYDRKNYRVSPVYASPLLVGYGKVVIPKIGRLAVTDIFDKNVYYKEILFADYPRVANPVDAFREIKWQDEHTLSVTYADENFTRKTAVFDLNEEQPGVAEGFAVIDAAKEYLVLKGTINGKVFTRYVIRIFDDAGNVLYEQDYGGKPQVRMLDKDVAEIALTVSGALPYVRYYDREYNRVSPTYYKPLLVGDRKIVFAGYGKIVLADQFDRNQSYKVVFVENFVPNFDVLESFRWDSPDTLVVTYSMKREGEIKRNTVVFNLKE
jgi:hypothetical protein